jgi:hypothetical protein
MSPGFYYTDDDASQRADKEKGYENGTIPNNRKSF